MILRYVLILFFLGLVGCDRSALVVHQQKISPSYLASTNVGSPDPRTPPSGQMIVAEWWLNKQAMRFDPILRLSILFHDFSEDVVEYPICSKIGYETYFLVNEKFKETGGLLSYRAEIITCDGEVYADWKHQLWVKLIDINDDTEVRSSAVVEKSKQGSVIETPCCNSSK
ncbi:MAG: hypothetical protein K1000chlam2_00364 [Chlamydiae bacterium]|nr:hypothetical protein [Chlamydiota bacterium]